MNKGTLDNFGLWCPFCGKNTIRKKIDGCKFILCENFINCDYFEIKEYNGIDNEKHIYEKNKENRESYCIKKLKQFIADEKIAEDNRNRKHRDNQYAKHGKKGSKNTLKNNELEINKDEEENNLNLILDILNENKREKTKIELYREESRKKRDLSKQRRTTKQQAKRSERLKKEKEKKIKKERDLKKEEFKKEKEILKMFNEKYKKLFNNEELSLENINEVNFTKEEVKVGLKEYEKEQFLIEKELRNRKEKEKIKELKKMRRRVEI